MAVQIHRYRTTKPVDGHFSFQLHEGASVKGYTEHWHTENGWEVVLDVQVNLRKPLERRYFFIATNGDDIDFLDPDNPTDPMPEMYECGSHKDKAYISYLFETTHLTEDQRAQGKANWGRLNRPKPLRSEMSSSERLHEDARLLREEERRRRETHRRSSAGETGPTAVAQAIAEAAGV